MEGPRRELGASSTTNPLGHASDPHPDRAFVGPGPGGRTSTSTSSTPLPRPGRLIAAARRRGGGRRAHVRAGRPPGTGKSQTITNLLTRARRGGQAGAVRRREAGRPRRRAEARSTPSAWARSRSTCTTSGSKPAAVRAQIQARPRARPSCRRAGPRRADRSPALGRGATCIRYAGGCTSPTRAGLSLLRRPASRARDRRRRGADCRSRTACCSSAGPEHRRPAPATVRRASRRRLRRPPASRSLRGRSSTGRPASTSRRCFRLPGRFDRGPSRAACRHSVRRSRRSGLRPTWRSLAEVTESAPAAAGARRVAHAAVARGGRRAVRQVAEFAAAPHRRPGRRHPGGARRCRSTRSTPRRAAARVVRFFGRRKRLAAVADRLAPVGPARRDRQAEAAPELDRGTLTCRTACDAPRQQVRAIPGLALPSGWTPFADDARRLLDAGRPGTPAGQLVDPARPEHAESSRRCVSFSTPAREPTRGRCARLAAALRRAAAVRPCGSRESRTGRASSGLVDPLARTAAERARSPTRTWARCGVGSTSSSTSSPCVPQV